MSETYLCDQAAQEQICEIGRRLYQRGLIGGVDGNISCRVGPDAVWITPSMSCKGFLTPEMLIKTDLKGKPLQDGGGRMSSESWMHLTIYRENPQIHAVIHAHPAYATVLASVGKDVPADLLAEGVYFFGDCLHVAPFAQPGTAELGDSVLPYCRSSSAALLANHGAVSWGADLLSALIAMESTENYCRVYLYTRYLVGEQAEIPPEKKALLARLYPSI